MQPSLPRPVRPVTPWLALTLILLAASAGCVPAKYSQSELQDAAEFVRLRMGTKFPHAEVRWVQGPQSAAGSENVLVSGDLEVRSADKLTRLFLCNSVLRRRNDKWLVLSMKVLDRNALGSLPRNVPGVTISAPNAPTSPAPPVAQ